MKFRALLAAVCLLPLWAQPVSGMSKKPAVSVRFHSEANPRDGGSFSSPITFTNLNRKGHIMTVPALSEREVAAVFPFKASDDTWGCTFQFDAMGRNRLESVTTEQRGTAMVFFIATKQGRRQVTDMLIDRVVATGMITIPRGLNDTEVAALRKEFKVIGEGPKKTRKERKAEEKRKKEEAEKETGILPPVDPAAPRLPAPAPSDVPPPSRRQLREMDLPRVAD